MSKYAHCEHDSNFFSFIKSKSKYAMKDYMI